MPKLSDKQIKKNKAHIEKAALLAFLKSGYHGMSVRNLADAADVSLGNLYNYYPDKLSLFKSIIKNQTLYFLSEENPIELYIKDCEFPNDLEKLAEAVKLAVVKYKSFFKLIYIDVVEFDGEHTGDSFSNVYAKFDSKLGKHFKSLGKLGRNNNLDPGFAFVSVYLLFYYYFALKNLFRSKKIFGENSEKEVVDKITELFLFGISGA